MRLVVAQWVVIVAAKACERALSEGSTRDGELDRPGMGMLRRVLGVGLM